MTMRTSVSTSGSASAAFSRVRASCSCAMAPLNIVLAGGGTARAGTAASTQHHRKAVLATVCFTIRSPQLRVHLVEVRLVDEHLSRFAARGGRHQTFHFHHVDEPRRPAEADAQPPLQVRDRCLTALDDDARGLVVEIV